LKKKGFAGKLSLINQSDDFLSLAHGSGLGDDRVGAVGEWLSDSSDSGGVWL